jgi:hypothetical protein
MNDEVCEGTHYDKNIWWIDVVKVVDELSGRERRSCGSCLDAYDQETDDDSVQ